MMMDIARLSMNMADYKNSTSISMAVMKNVKEMIEDQGAQINKLMETIPMPQDFTVDYSV